MTIEIHNPDLEALIRRCVASGGYANAEEVVRRALEVLDAEETWTSEERQALDTKIDRALEQVASGNVYGPEEARQRLAAMRDAHPAKRDR